MVRRKRVAIPRTEVNSPERSFKYLLQPFQESQENIEVRSTSTNSARRSIGHVSPRMIRRKNGTESLIYSFHQGSAADIAATNNFNNNGNTMMIPGNSSSSNSES